MVGVFQRHKPAPFRPAPVVPVLDGNFKRRFHSTGAITRKEYAPVAIRKQLQNYKTWLIKIE